MDYLIQDVRVGLRHLRRDKTFTLTAALTLAVCLAANTALFSVVENVVLRPLALPESDRVVLMANGYPKLGADNPVDSAAVPDYYDRLRGTTVFETQALLRIADQRIDQGGTPARIRVMAVTPSFFPLVRVPPLLGRAFTPEEGEIGNDQKVVLSYALWQSQFGGDPNVVGRDLRIDGRPLAVVGVMPRSFVFVDDGVAAWRALAFTDRQKSDQQRHNNNSRHVGRLKPGATVAQAQAQVDALNTANLERFPEMKQNLLNAGFHTRVQRLQDYLIGNVRATLYLLWGGALFVLLIGGVNVAGLVLIRSRARLKELATRVALGASSAQLARQLVTETAMLTLGSAAAGLALGYALLLSLGAANIQALPRGSQIGFDGVVAAYSVGLALVLAVVLACVPLVAAMRANVTTVLRAEGRAGSAGRSARTLRRGLVAAQMGLTFVLLVGAGLLLASFRHVLAIDRGFNPDHVLTATVSLPYERYQNDAPIRQFMEETSRRLRALPGVVSVGTTNTIPLGAVPHNNVILPEGQQGKPGASLLAPMRVIVTPGYFETMGARLARGRFFDERDREQSQGVIVVDQKLAARFWPDQEPIGRRLYFPVDANLAIKPDTPLYTVVGVVHNVRLGGLVEGAHEVGAYYLPFDQRSPFGGSWAWAEGRTVSFAIRTANAPETLASAVRSAINGVDRELPVYDIRTMAQWETRSLTSRRSAVLLSSAFGAVALFLSVIGIYGMLAYLVAQRTKEIGIRVVLGSSARKVFALILREGALLIAGGLLLGGLGAMALRKVLEPQLFGISAADPTVLLSAMALLALVALAACLLPARRATRINPTVALAE